MWSGAKLTVSRATSMSSNSVTVREGRCRITSPGCSPHRSTCGRVTAWRCSGWCGDNAQEVSQDPVERDLLLLACDDMGKLRPHHPARLRDPVLERLRQPRPSEDVGPGVDDEGGNLDSLELFARVMVQARLDQASVRLGATVEV